MDYWSIKLTSQKMRQHPSVYQKSPTAQQNPDVNLQLFSVGFICLAVLRQPVVLTSGAN